MLSIADGRIYSVEQAKELGLVDELGTLEDAYEAAKQLAGLEEAQIIRYVYPSMGWLELTGLLGKTPVSPLSELKQWWPMSPGPRLMYLFQPTSP